jgi:predicted DNA-binding ribbon-helix-helix protein
MSPTPVGIGAAPSFERGEVCLHSPSERGYGASGAECNEVISRCGIDLGAQPACAHRKCRGSHQSFFSPAFDTCMFLGAQKAAIPCHRMKARSVLIARSKTSLRLEQAFWVGLQEIADKRGTTLSRLVGTIDAQRRHGTRSSAVRLFVLEFYRSQVSDANNRGISVPNPPPPPASRREPPGS